MLTDQQIFDRVAVHLIEQGEPSLAYAGVSLCMYRGGEGRMCAVGRLIPDNAYDPDMERKSVLDLFNEFPRAMQVAGLEWRQRWLLQALQDVHDNHNPKDWDEQLGKVASHYQLKTAALDAALEARHA